MLRINDDYQCVFISFWGGNNNTCVKYVQYERGCAVQASRLSSFVVLNNLLCDLMTAFCEGSKILAENS